MSFSPLAFCLSAAITSSAFGGLLLAPDRHYRVTGYHGGSLFLLEEKSDSLLARADENILSPDICVRSRPWEVAIREYQDRRTEISYQEQGDLKLNHGGNFQLALTIMLPPEPLKYSRKWPFSCQIPNGDHMIKAYPSDARIPYDAVPISYEPDQEISACLKVNSDGEVTGFKFAHSSMKISNEFSQKIEKVARKCWRFNNLSGEPGWIQVGLDKRVEVYSS